EFNARRLVDSIEIRFCPEDTTGCVTAELILQLNGAILDTLHVSGCSGVGILEAEPQKVMFDTTAIGSFDDQKVVIRNIGNYPLTITDHIFSNDVFSLARDPGNLVLDPDVFDTVTFRFTPKVSGRNNGTNVPVHDGDNS